jgi:hypothetical protein
MEVRDTLGAGMRVARLPADARRRTLEAVAQLTRASLELRLLPSTRTAGLLGTVRNVDDDASGGPDGMYEAERVGRAVAGAARRLPWRPTCLRQALAVQRMLRRRGIAGRLHLGVTSPSEGTAHAWVTVDGHPVVGRPGLERYVPLATFE